MTTFDYYFLSTILVVLGCLIIFLLLAALEVFLENFKWYKDMKAEFTETKNQYNSRNKLVVCRHNDCQRMYRFYQTQLTKAVARKNVCPHCSKSRNNRITMNPEFSVVTKQDKWMASHIDCPAIGKREYYKIRQAIKTAEQLRKDEAAMKRFEEYNQFSVDVSWIKNLQKKE